MHGGCRAALDDRCRQSEGQNAAACRNGHVLSARQFVGDRSSQNLAAGLDVPEFGARIRVQRKERLEVRAEYDVPAVLVRPPMVGASRRGDGCIASASGPLSLPSLSRRRSCLHQARRGCPHED